MAQPMYMQQQQQQPAYMLQQPAQPAPYYNQQPMIQQPMLPMAQPSNAALMNNIKQLVVVGLVAAAIFVVMQVSRFFDPWYEYEIAFSEDSMAVIFYLFSVSTTGYDGGQHSYNDDDFNKFKTTFYSAAVGVVLMVALGVGIAAMYGKLNTLCEKLVRRPYNVYVSEVEDAKKALSNIINISCAAVIACMVLTAAFQMLFTKGFKDSMPDGYCDNTPCDSFIGSYSDGYTSSSWGPTAGYYLGTPFMPICCLILAYIARQKIMILARTAQPDVMTNMSNGNYAPPAAAGYAGQQQQPLYQAQQPLYQQQPSSSSSGVVMTSTAPMTTLSTDVPPSYEHAQVKQ